MIDHDKHYDVYITLRALSIYCLYATIRAVRHGTIPMNFAKDAFGQFVFDAIKGHKRATSAHYAVRIRPRAPAAADDIPVHGGARARRRQ